MPSPPDRTESTEFRRMTHPVFRALAAAVLAAGPAQAAGPHPETVGNPVAPLAVTGPDGRPATVGPAADRAATVVVFLSFDCPVSTSYCDQLSGMAKSYAGKGVGFVGVVPGDDAADAVSKKAAEYKVGFPVHTDPTGAAVAALHAATVPEAFVLDKGFVVRYRGRVDDAYSARLKRNPSVTTHDLRDAVDAVLAGAEVKVPTTRPVGCPIGKPEPAAKPGAAGGVTFHRDVVPVLQANCVGCHRPGQVGPFSLTTYKQAVAWADDVKHYTHDRKMPPWKPVGGPGYANERAMADKDIATLAAWVDGGCPEGDPKDAPPPPTYSDEWQLGTPDLVLSVEDDYHVGPAGPDLFRCFVLPTGLTEDRYIVGYEVKPGNPRVVHHTLNFWDASGQARKLADKAKARSKPSEAGDHGPGYSVGMGVGFLPTPDPKRPGQPTVGGFGGWAPGQLATKLPAGAGHLLPAGADVVLQTHYHRTGKPEADRTRVGLYFSKGPVEKVWQSVAVTPRLTPQQMIGLVKSPFEIPPGQPDWKAKGSVWLLGDATVHSVVPHMHLVGRSIKVTMTPPGGAPVTLVDIPDWDYNWQETYWLKEPVKAPAGTRLDVEGVYDNSTGNPHNPFSPPRKIVFGEQTTQEMLFGFVGLIPAGKDRVRVARTDPALAGGK